MNSALEAAKIVNDIVSSSRRPESVSYFGEILERSRDESVSSEIRKYLKAVGEVASYHIENEDTLDPFGPIFQSHDGRSAIPSDLSDEDLDQLKEVCGHIESLELVARIQDILWLRLRKIEYAEKAIKTYLSCAEQRFDLVHWTFCVECAERALRLGSLFRRKQPELCKSAADLLLSWIHKYSDSDKGFLTDHAIRLLIQFGYGDSKDFQAIALKIAKEAEDTNDFHRAEEYWKLAVLCARKNEDENTANSAQTALAECYIKNSRLHKDSGMLAAHWLQQAIEAYKSVPGSKGKREDLYTELREYQKKSLSEMSTIEHSLDISDIINETIDIMEGKTTREALFILVFKLARPPVYAKLEKQALELAQKYPLSHLFGAVHIDHEGKVTARSKGAFDSPDGISPREVYGLAAQEHQLIVLGHILPAIEIISSEHYITEQDFLSVVVNNPFVAHGQELLYAKGLYAGLKRDYVIALSILIPLLENSIRKVLSDSGERVSTLKSDSTQEVLRIGALLEHDKTTEIFGEDVVRDLRGLLIERTYGNMRNGLSHGLMYQSSFQHPSVVYLWWLVLRLCLTPFYNSMTSSDSDNNSGSEN